MNNDLDIGETLRGFRAGQQVFGRYELVRQLGQGGMGVVWLANDAKLERQVALKFLPEVLAKDAEAVRDLKRETKRALELTHPNIVRIYDFLEDARYAAISMEYVEGVSLSAMKLESASGHLEVAELKPWVEQLCGALTYAHRDGKVVHRDLKPANLMINTSGVLKVMDFGISATLTDTATRASRHVGSSGTPVYMSPQQMMGEKPSATDDVYSLGATLYELLTGKPPFYAGNIMMQVQGKEAPRMSERRAELNGSGVEIPMAWEETVKACLAKESAQRPQSIGEVWERLNGSVGASLATPSEGRAMPPAEPSPTTNPPVATTLPAATSESASAKNGLKAPLVLVAVAVCVLVAVLGYYFGVQVPAQERAEALRRESEERIARMMKPFTVPGVNLEMMPIAAGSFRMGGSGGDETPHTVRITKPYWLGKYEVTQGQWEELMGTTATQQKDKVEENKKYRLDGEGANYPMYYITWEEAMEFCRKLTSRERGAGRLPEGYEYTLPTEAEWEYACRAGTATTYSWGEAFVVGKANMGNWDRDNGTAEQKVSIEEFRKRGLPVGSTMAVGQFAANAWGLYDMHGNVWEWCRDWYDKDYYGKSPSADPTGPATGSFRVIRGGSWYFSAGFCRSAFRDWGEPGGRSNDLGFRVALSPVGGR